MSSSTFNQALNAARFFFLEVLKRPFVVEGLRYQKQPRRLPAVMNDGEVSRLLAASSSLRDRALLETRYVRSTHLRGERRGLPVRSFVATM